MAIHPPDAAVAARSFPRRWRALFATAAGDDDHPDLLERSGAAALADQAAQTLTATAGRIPATATGGGDDIDAAADHLARAIESVPADQWTPGDLDALTSGIDQVAALLRQAERQIDEARRAR